MARKPRAQQGEEAARAGRGNMWSMVPDSNAPGGEKLQGKWASPGERGRAEPARKFPYPPSGGIR